MKRFFQEFKTFAMRGNVLDMAIGVVVGAAFKTIVDSLVNDIISPVIGLFFATDFSAVVLTVRGVDIGIGSFLNAVINFVIVAFSLFVVVKAAHSTRRALLGALQHRSLRNSDNPSAKLPREKSPAL